MPTILALALGLYLWMFVELTIHESAHLLAAKAVGLATFAFTVGTGPLLFRRRIGNVQVEFRCIPRFGMVHARPVLKGLWWKGSMFCMAGPLADTLLLVLFLNLAGFKAGGPHVSDAWLAKGFFAILAVYQFVIIAANLIPAHFMVQGAKIPNDGRQFLDYLTGRTSKALHDYEKGVVAYDPEFRVTDSWAMRGDPSMMAVLLAAEQDTAAGRYTAATEKYLRVISETEMHAAEKALLLDKMACIPVFHGEKNFLAAAETWAKQAWALFPQSKTIRGTLGSILVEKGDCTNGLAMLLPLTSQDNSPIDRALASCYVAKAFHCLGNPMEAGKWLEAARNCGVFPEVRARIEQELSRQAKIPFWKLSRLKQKFGAL